MAAAYSAGTATGSVDLLQKLVAFMVAQGWTSNLSVGDGSGWRAHLSKGGVYANFRAYTNADTNSNIWTNATAYSGQAKSGIAMYLGDAFSGAAAWRLQGGGPVNLAAVAVGANMQVRSDTVTFYRFFDDGADNIAAVVETIPGLFVYLFFGVSMTKAGTWTGGPYFGASAPSYDLTGQATSAGWDVNAHAPFSFGGVQGIQQNAARAFVRVDVDGVAPKWARFASGVSTTTDGNTGLECQSDAFGFSSASSSNPPIYDGLVQYTASAFNGRTALLPIHFYVARTGGGHSLLGEIPLYLGWGSFAAGSVYSVGAEDFVAFPTNIAGYYYFVPKKA